MRTTCIIKKTTAIAAATALVLSLVPSLPGTVEARAEVSGTGAEPSVQVYADVATLTASDDNIFTPKYKEDGSFDSDSTKVAKLKFGKVGGKAIEWYILGPDSNIDGEAKNIAIFATDNIVNKIFRPVDETGYTYEGDSDEEYVEGTRAVGATIFPCHYGESELREELRKMSSLDDDTEGIIDPYQYFSSTEKAIMQKTKVLTHDYKDEYNPEDVDRRYTTNDKLYLASGEKYTSVIYVGNKGESNDEQAEYTGKILSKEVYWTTNIGKEFWLRSPAPDNVGYYVLCTTTYSDFPISGLAFNSGEGVRPASNLKLTNVLFASAADADEASESGVTKTIDRGTDTVPKAAMTLRLNGEGAEALDGKTIGEVKLAGGNTVKVTKGTADDVTLIIQGRDGNTDKDWYYAKSITADNVDTAVTAADISGYTDADLSTCKIWLETSGTDGMIYAVKATTEAAHVHTYDDTWTKIDDEQHAHLCIATDCDDREGSAKDNENHTYDIDNVCTKCGYHMDGHIVTKVEEQPPTSTTVGYREHFECSHCDLWFIYPATLGALFAEDKSYFEIPATGNNGDGSTRNSERYSGSGSSSSGSGGGSGSSSVTSNIIGAGSTAAASGTWVKDNIGWRYRYSDGTFASGSSANDADGKPVEKTAWIRIGSADYAFGSDTYLRIGWIYDNTDGKWYYCDENGGKLHGWFYDTVDGYWYYLDTNTGAMLTGWQLIGGKQYYFAPAPAAATYAFDTASSKWVYSNASNLRPYGSMYADTTTPDNHQVGADGARVQ